MRIVWLTGDFFGIIIHNDGGKVVAALCKALPSCYPVEWTEVFALEQGIILAQQLAISNVIIESDLALAIQAISQDLCGGEVGHLIQGILRAKPLSLNALSDT